MHIPELNPDNGGKYYAIQNNPTNILRLVGFIIRMDLYNFDRFRKHLVIEIGTKEDKEIKTAINNYKEQGYNIYYVYEEGEEGSEILNPDYRDGIEPVYYKLV